MYQYGICSAAIHRTAYLLTSIRIYDPRPGLIDTTYAWNYVHLAKLRLSTSGVPFCGAGRIGDQISLPLGARLLHYAFELRTLSVIYLLCGKALTDTTDNQSEMCPLKLTDFCLFLYHRSYTILQGCLLYTSPSPRD